VDFSLELEAEFPEDMVLEMQGNAAKKTRRTVIGWTLGGRATFKTLHECLKLHLPVSFILATLLTREYFLILFKNEEGAIATKKLTSMEWSGLSLSFSRYTLSFDANTQGAKALLTHTIKVQFPDLHKQFRNVRALTIMASKLGEVLDIEAVDSYVKRPAGPMVTIEINDITKLAGYIRIPSMAEGVSTTDTICQWILYSGLPNQCRKCCKFGHHARICTVNKIKLQEGPTQHNFHQGVGLGKHARLRLTPQGAPRKSNQGLSLKTFANPHATVKTKAREEAKSSMDLPSAHENTTDQVIKHTESATLNPNHWNSTSTLQKD
jgi:hypothetical protein